MIVWELLAPTRMLAWLQARPSHCDRGRWVQGIEIAVWRSEQDPAPRYYFDLAAAKAETIAYLQAKGVDVSDAKWRAVDTAAAEGRAATAIAAAIARTKRGGP
jgi:hypothetical protein